MNTLLLTFLLVLIMVLSVSKVYSFFWSKTETGYFFWNEEVKGGYLDVFNKDKDGIYLSIKVPGIRPCDHWIKDKYMSFVDLGIGKDDSEGFILTKCRNEITFNDGKNRVEKMINVLVVTSGQDPKPNPKTIDKTEYYVMTEQYDNRTKHLKYNSFEEIPEKYRKTPMIEKKDYYGEGKHRWIASKNIYFIYYDFPKEGVDKITYHLEMEIKKGNKIYTINKTYELNKTPYQDEE